MHPHTKSRLIIGAIVVAAISCALLGAYWNAARPTYWLVQFLALWPCSAVWFGYFCPLMRGRAERQKMGAAAGCLAVQIGIGGLMWLFRWDSPWQMPAWQMYTLCLSVALYLLSPLMAFHIAGRKNRQKYSWAVGVWTTGGWGLVALLLIPVRTWSIFGRTLPEPIDSKAEHGFFARLSAAETPELVRIAHGKVIVTVDNSRDWRSMAIFGLVAFVSATLVAGSWTSTWNHISGRDAFFLLVAVVAIIGAIYQFSGPEVAEFSEETLVVRKQFLRWAQESSYAITDCEKLEWYMGDGEGGCRKMQLRAGGNTIEFASGITREQSEQVLAALRDHLPRVHSKLCAAEENLLLYY